MQIRIVSRGMSASAISLQPWRYLGEIAKGLASLGHQVEVVSDVPDSLAARVDGVGYVLDPPLFARRRRHRPATDADLTIWHVGSTSIGTLRLMGPSGLNVAVFTSPLYSLFDLSRAGTDVLRSPKSYLALIAASVVPMSNLAKYLASSFDLTVVLSPSTAQKLSAAGHPINRIEVIPPGRDIGLVDRSYSPPTHRDFQIAFAGNPEPIRGADLLLSAYAVARPRLPRTHVHFLMRHDNSRHRRLSQRLQNRAKRLGFEAEITVETARLTRAEFLRRLFESDVLALPFRLVPSEAPLLPIEAAALGVPLITSRLPAISDVASHGSVLVAPGNVASLAGALVRVGCDASHRLWMGRQARESASHTLPWVGVVGRFNDALTRLMNATDELRTRSQT